MCNDTRIGELIKLMLKVLLPATLIAIPAQFATGQDVALGEAEIRSACFDWGCAYWGDMVRIGICSDMRLEISVRWIGWGWYAFLIIRVALRLAQRVLKAVRRKSERLFLFDLTVRPDWIIGAVGLGVKGFAICARVRIDRGGWEDSAFWVVAYSGRFELVYVRRGRVWAIRVISRG